jgi:hypothetical protein
MSKLLCSCVDELFNKYDYNNIPIKSYLLKKHNNKENAWITIDKNVYSIRKDDTLLLDIFKNFYGKNIKKFILTDKIFNNMKNRIIILEKLKYRKIGYLSN